MVEWTNLQHITALHSLLPLAGVTDLSEVQHQHEEQRARLATVCR